MAKPDLLLPLLLLLLNHASPALSDNPHSNHHRPNFHPSTGLITVAILVAALLLVAFVSLYVQRCRNRGPADVLPLVDVRRRIAAAKRGLDLAVIESFPTLTHSELLESRPVDPGFMECAVCLGEFAGHETLRLLPTCGHTFHLDCIDMWLESHVTCPVCRARLDAAQPPGDAVVAMGVGDMEGVERCGPRVLKRCSSSVAGGEGTGRWEWKVKSDRWAFAATVEGRRRSGGGEGLASGDGGGGAT